MLYIPFFDYTPHSASVNRLFAYLKAISEAGIKARVVFFLREHGPFRVEEQLPGIEFQYMWERWYINLPRMNRLLSLRLYLYQFVKRLSSGDTVFVYGFPDMLMALSHRTDIRVFHETTEHPKASFGACLSTTTLVRYHEVCAKLDGVIVISQGLKDYFIQHGCDSSRVYVVNMIVDTSRFEGLKKHKTESKYIAYCGTASNTKDGVDQLIKAFALVVKRHPEYKLYIIGRTPSKQQYFENKNMVRDLGLEENVVFTGVVASDKMPQILKDAEILALARPDNLQAQYGFPTKLGEYLLSANPVIITRVGDIPLFLKDGESALIAEAGSPRAFANKLCWAIDFPDEAKKIGLNGKHVAEKHFNYETETHKLLKIMNLNIVNNE